jgi:hypothetical protein
MGIYQQQSVDPAEIVIWFEAERKSRGTPW